ncbi:hypothetical protein [Anaerotruncus colihominis]|uniref:Uncharacterized protein n=1 Tax=Anaerotruncus colihominis TaxID=169435 RepID=A0A1Y4EHB7_9FIRM|nr:hypothetical protein [Anaerotruncus colihominis]OUO67950.1 hypothetical protein B5F55_07595 [Anaerotruncus colihominis]OUP69489.1 hypothetical protein B5F11_09070 [Anaerotruncus colihominis]OUP74463.1 hypothetical protein B5F10_07330 [Anaerotruncus colihominis]
MGLTTQCSSVPRFYRSLFDIVDTARERGIVFYGAGFWGEITWRIFRLFSVKPLCFCDDDPDKRTQPHPLTQAPVLDIDEAVRRYPNAVYLATVSNIGGKAAPRYRMNMVLQERGVLSADSGFHASRYTFLLEDHVYAQINAPIKRVEGVFHKEHLDRILFLTHMGNSGILYLNQLLDNHPNLINIAMLGQMVDLATLFDNRLKYLSGRELAIEITSQMSPYLKTSLPEHAFFKASRLAEKFYLDQSGNPEQRLYIDAAVFLRFLLQELPTDRTVSYAKLLCCIFAAYANAVGKPFDPQKTYWMLYEIHQANYDISQLNHYIRNGDFADHRYLFIVREPVRHFYAAFKRLIVQEKPHDRDYHIRHSVLELISCDLGLTAEQSEECRDMQMRLVRFEDAKRNRRQTMQAICTWINVSYDECMETATTNGIPVYFPATARGGGVYGADSMSAVEPCDYSDLLSEFDVFRLNLFFQYFKRACAYPVDVPDLQSFSQDFIKELLRYPFRFEEVVKRLREQDEKLPGIHSDLPDYAGRIRELLLSYAQRKEEHTYFPCINPMK